MPGFALGLSGVSGGARSLCDRSSMQQKAQPLRPARSRELVLFGVWSSSCFPMICVCPRNLAPCCLQSSFPLQGTHRCRKELGCTLRPAQLSEATCWDAAGSGRAPRESSVPHLSARGETPQGAGSRQEGTARLRGAGPHECVPIRSALLQ